jgi:ABC-2 type transport system permease protein
LAAGRDHDFRSPTLFLAGTVWPILLPDLLALLGFAALFLAVAIARTRRSLE